MVHVKDEGVFDAPLDKVWKFLQDDSEGVHTHQAIRGTKVLEAKGPMLTQEMEFVNPDGKSTRKETWRFTFNPPQGFQMEAVAGALKGTRYSHRYTARGNQTHVLVEGDFHIEGMDDAATLAAALGFLSQAFDEDTANLKRYK